MSSSSRSSSRALSFHKDTKRRRTISCDAIPKPLAHFVASPSKLANEAMESIDWNKVLTMLPPCLKGRSREDVLQLITEELEGMSRKRVLSVLEGNELQSSSSSEEEEEPLSDSEEDHDIDRVSVSAAPSGQLEEEQSLSPTQRSPHGSEIFADIELVEGFNDRIEDDTDKNDSTS